MATDDRTMDWLVIGLALLCAVLAVGLLVRPREMSPPVMPAPAEPQVDEQT